MKVSIIVPVAGKGKRFGGEIPKQFYELAGQPIILHTIKNMMTSPLISGGVIVCGAEDIKMMEDIFSSIQGFQEKFIIVFGGDKRQNSVYNGFNSIGNDVDYVLIQDGVRPFISNELIEKCIMGAKQFGSCIAAVPVSDTIKRIQDGNIIETVDRKDLYRAQTPQVFKYKILSESYKKSKKENLSFTDESSMVEWAGYEVHVVEGSDKNIKITTQNDILSAEKILENWN